MALAAVSPFILYVWWFSPIPSGATMGIWFWLIVFSINWELILFGIPTKPSSFLSGLTSIILLFFVWKDTAFEPNFFKFWTISLLKSIRTSSTTYFIFFDFSGDPLQGTAEFGASQVSLFPILPSVTWNFKF